MSTEFVAMTYNIGNGLAPTDSLRQMLRSTPADFVGLQEVSPEQAIVLEEDLPDLYPYRVVEGRGFAGRALLSRHPILDVEWIECQPDRPDLRARIDFEGRNLTVIVAHPSPPKPGRNGIVFDSVTLQQIRDSANLTVQARPAVLLGDFNMTIHNPAYQWMTEIGLTDAYVDVGNRGGRTFPVRFGRIRRLNLPLSWMPMRPVARLDYIWLTSEITPLEAWLGDDAGSDHLPVLARLSLTG
jgi:endonuclease/exonuclease/phosphatase family metal-dependent hydrolase